jgi:MOSC domain-containing protein YiiM
MTVRVIDTGFTGWYFRVLAEGEVRAGDALTLIERSFPALTIKLVNDAYHHDLADAAELEALVGCLALAQGWRNHFGKVLHGGS